MIIQMSDWQEILPEQERIDSSAAEMARVEFAKVPGKGAVYLLTQEGEGGRESRLLLATVGDLRAALKRRLADTPEAEKSKRIEYGKLATRIYYRRVDSAFAANWWYMRAARAVFPERYRELVPWRAGWWIGVEREGPFPKLRRANDLSDDAFAYAGPVRDRTAAAKLIETVEDLFDLCRYHQELVQAPHGKPCAYKEMGKCPAPCDGSVPVTWYRRQMGRAWAFLVSRPDRQVWQAENEVAMKAAAGRLEFETAGRIKSRLARAAVMAGEAYEQVRPLEEFSFLSLQPGKGKRWVEPFLVSGGRIEALPQVENHKSKKDMARAAAEECVNRCRAMRGERTLMKDDAESAALVCHHLFRGEREQGIWLRAGEVAEGGAAFVIEAMEKLAGRKEAVVPEQASDRAEKDLATEVKGEAEVASEGEG